MSDIIDYFSKKMDFMFNSFNKSFEKLNKSISSMYGKPSCEISQSTDSLVIKVELPGMEKKDVMLNITHDYLEIMAEKKGRVKKNYQKGERFAGYRRVIPLPPAVISDKAQAKFSKEKLTIKIPKIKIGKLKIK